MSASSEKLNYPENAYCDIFGGDVRDLIPSDAEELLKKALGALSEKESEMLSEIFMLRYKDDVSFEEIGKQVVATICRKIRHPSRSRFLIGASQRTILTERQV